VSASSSSHRLLSDFHLAVKLPVTWGQMDSFSHVNNIQYFKWFEDVRMAYFEASGIFDHMKTHSVGPILAKTQCRFVFPLTYPDTVHLGTRVEEVGEDRFTMVYRVVSERHERVAAEGQGRIVMFDYRSNEKAPIPPSLRQKMQALGAAL